MKLLTDIEKSISAPKNVSIRTSEKLLEKLTAIRNKYNPDIKPSRIIAHIISRAYSELQLQNVPDEIEIIKEPKEKILSLRLGAITIEQLEQLCSYYGKNTTDMLVFLIGEAFKQTGIKLKSDKEKSTKKRGKRSVVR